MADRGASASVIAELAKSATHPIHLFEAHFDSGVIYATDAYKAISYGGHSYLANGHFLSFEGITEQSELQTSEMRVSLSGVDQTWIAEVLSEEYIDRQLVIYKAFLDTATDALIADPVKIFDGRMDGPVINEDPENGTCTVTVPAASHFIDFTRKAGRHTNLAEWQIFFPGDNGPKFCSEIARNVIWGRATPVAAPQPSSNVGGNAGDPAPGGGGYEP